MTADVDCVPLDLSLNSTKYKFSNYTSEDDESSEYNSDHNEAESEDPEKPKDLKLTKAYKKNLMKRYRKSELFYLRRIIRISSVLMQRCYRM